MTQRDFECVIKNRTCAGKRQNELLTISLNLIHIFQQRKGFNRWPLK